MPGWRHSFVAVAAAVLLTSCGGPPPAPAPTPGLVPSADLVETTVEVPDAFTQPPFDQDRRAQVPPGWSMSVFARVPRARMLVFAPDGALLVSVPSTGQVLRLTDDGQSVLLDGLTQPHGMVFSGGQLYIAESNQVVAYQYSDGAASGIRVVAGGLPDGRSPELRGAYSHALKSVVMGTDGAVYFSIGSTGNISAEDREANPPRATIMRVPPGGGPAEPFATGVRNGTGLAVAPDGAVWTAVNNRDNVARPDDGVVDQEYVNDHPPESVARLNQGRELGWPYCNPDGGPADLPLIRDVQTNPAGELMDCAALPPIEQSLGAHSAPLGMAFGDLPAPFGAGALVGVHGSWNRTPARAPEVAFFPWRDGYLGDAQTLAGGFQNSNGFRWGRPVAAVVGPDGSVYITDDYAGAVYRLTPG